MRTVAVLVAVTFVSFVAADVLFDGGPLVNYPGQGFGGRDASAIQVDLLENIYGYGVQKAGTTDNRGADDFTVTGAGWQINTIKFFGYQTGSGTTSTINNVNVRIWNGIPGEGGTVVWGDTTTNRLTNATWSQIYRSISTSLTNTTRPIMQLTTSTPVTLGPGSYWVDFQFAGSLSSGPWAPPVSILDMTGPPDANARQYTSVAGAWAYVLDSGNSTADAFPFVIEGTIIPEPASMVLLGLVGLLIRRR